jgi:glucose-6-phosphate 1-dehydrogenase
MVIFGAAGDLTKRLVVPALYNLIVARRLSDEFRLVGVDLTAQTAEEWCKGLTDAMQQFVGKDGGHQIGRLDQDAWRWLTERMSYLQGDLNDPGTYDRLGKHLAELDETAGTAGNYLFYLAVADRFFGVVVARLAAVGLVTEREGQWRRVVIEKPFGHDLLLAMTAMELPISFDADAVRAKKADVIQAVHPFEPASVLNDVVRGQYGAGTVLDQALQAYRQEPEVAPDSNIETFIAFKLNIDNWRWAGVPFYLRTGKHLKRRVTEIAIRFHQAPFTLFRGTDVERMNPNWMILRIQPDEGIALEFAAKRPGPSVKLSTVSMDFAYKTYFRIEPSTGYETLIFDCMIGDATLFQRADNIEAGWQAVQPILDVWADNVPRDFPNYASGGSGPAAADELLARDGRAWRPLD